MGSSEPPEPHLDLLLGLAYFAHDVGYTSVTFQKVDFIPERIGHGKEISNEPLPTCSISPA